MPCIHDVVGACISIHYSADSLTLRPEMIARFTTHDEAKRPAKQALHSHAVAVNREIMALLTVLPMHSMTEGFT